jgi:peptidoglycan/LPS O-acetylase OafA/YrhL
MGAKQRKQSVRAAAGPGHIPQIDLLKGLAIISVILIHTLSIDLLLTTGAPFHIWQAVPVFIILAGFTGAASLRRAGAADLTAAYDHRILLRRFTRILVPFFVVCIALVLIIAVLLLPAFTVEGVMVSFAGLMTDIALNQSWFMILILQHIVIVPALYLLALRSPDTMLVASFGVSIALEILFRSFGVPPALFIFTYVRYLFAGALGVWLFMAPRRKWTWILPGAVLSVLYITAVAYFGAALPFLYPEDWFFHAPEFFWPLVIVIAGLAWSAPALLKAPSHVIEELGKASWHIFLVQMVYFIIVFGPLTAAVNGIPGSQAENPATGPAFLLVLVLNLAICLATGYLFYRAGEKVPKLPLFRRDGS